MTNCEVFSNYSLANVKKAYELWADDNSPDSDTVSFIDWLDMKYVQPNEYKWVCTSDDGYFEDSQIDNNETFNTQEEAYESMKNYAIAKVECYCDYNEVIEDCCPFNDVKNCNIVTTPDDMGVHCDIEFHPHKIILDRNGCIYEYNIEKIRD